MTPPLLDAHGRATPATTFLLIHRALRRDLVLLHAVAGATARPDAGQAGWVQERWRLFRRVLSEHHHAEDERIFPALRAHAPQLAPVLDVLDVQHAALAAVLDRAEAALDALPDPSQQAVAAVADLERVLDAHLSLEEQHLVPVMITAPTGPPPSGRGVDPDVLRWTGEGLDAATVQALAAVRG